MIGGGQAIMELIPRPIWILLPSTVYGAL